METMRKYHIMIAALIVLCEPDDEMLVSQKITLHDSIDIVPACPLDPRSEPGSGLRPVR